MIHMAATGRDTDITQTPADTAHTADLQTCSVGFVRNISPGLHINLPFMALKPINGEL